MANCLMQHANGQILLCTDYSSCLPLHYTHAGTLHPAGPETAGKVKRTAIDNNAGTELSMAKIPVKGQHLAKIHCVAMTEQENRDNTFVWYICYNNSGVATCSFMCFCWQMYNFTI